MPDSTTASNLIEDMPLLDLSCQLASPRAFCSALCATLSSAALYVCCRNALKLHGTCQLASPCFSLAAAAAATQAAACDSGQSQGWHTQHGLQVCFSVHSHIAWQTCMHSRMACQARTPSHIAHQTCMHLHIACPACMHSHIACQACIVRAAYC